MKVTGWPGAHHRWKEMSINHIMNSLLLLLADSFTLSNVELNYKQTTNKQVITRANRFVRSLTSIPHFFYLSREPNSLHYVLIDGSQPPLPLVLAAYIGHHYLPRLWPRIQKHRGPPWTALDRPGSTTALLGGSPPSPPEPV
jgi:hypothetical protein